MRWIAPFLTAAVVLAACGTSNPRNLLVLVPSDAGTDAATSVDAGPGFLGNDDAGGNLGAPCVDDAQCNDNIACTYDSCSKTLGRCSNVPDNTQCDDHVYCDGQEVCVVGHGCEDGPVVSCDNGDPCMIATCVEASRACVYAARDVDQDGDPDAHCVPHHDCNDLNPNVSSRHAEVCGNGIDDNCNGLVDENPCVSPQGLTCANPIQVMSQGTVSVSTVGANKTFATSCGVSQPAGSENVVVAIVVPAGPNVDLEVWATTGSVEVAVEIDSACGQGAAPLGCGNGMGATNVRALAHNVGPGTYYAIVTTQSPTAAEVEVNYLTPAPVATNVDCPSAAPITPGTPITVRIIDPPTNLTTRCTPGTGELTYTFSLAQPEDVRIVSTTVQGSGSPIVGLRSATCTEITCDSGLPPLYARAQPAGRYVVTVAATSSIDATLSVELSPPTATPPDQSCTMPPSIAMNGRVSFDLSNHASSAINDGCFPGHPDAAYDLLLSSRSDVLLVGRIPETDTGAVALDPAACDLSIACEPAVTTPMRVSQRNVPPGDYRAVVTDELALQGTLDALVRPTVAPTIIPAGGADTCAQAVDASHGGFFTGNTATANADYDDGCDAPDQPTGGAPDQVLSLNLTEPHRVVLDMEGSNYTTLLDVFAGPACPGVEVPGGCYVGYAAQRSFLDIELPAGTYWLVIDGYNSQRGLWDLDVRVLPP